MISRRKFTAGGVAASYLAWRELSSEAKLLNSLPAPAVGGVSRFVQPKIGTGGHGHCYPGATVPFGMVQLSPDTLQSRLGLVFRIQLLGRFNHGVQSHSSEWDGNRGHA